MSEHNPKRCQRCLIARVEELEAQVQAVRGACDAAFPINDIPTLVVTRSAVLHALDGDSVSDQDMAWDGLAESPEEVIQRITELTTEVDALRAQVQVVRELHAPHDDCPDGYAMCAGRGMCYACGTHWPCATIRILNGGDA